MIGYTDFQNWMTQKEYRNAKEYLERKNIVSFTGTKAGTIAKISNKIFDMNIEGRDKGRERAELENLEDSVIIEDLPLQKNELEQKGQSNGRLTKNYIKNKEYNINNYNYNNKYIGSKIKKFFPEYNKILTNF